MCPFHIQGWKGLGPGGQAVAVGESGPAEGLGVAQGSGLRRACVGTSLLWGLSPAENC